MAKFCACEKVKTRINRADRILDDHWVGRCVSNNMNPRRHVSLHGMTDLRKVSPIVTGRHRS
jgi:hypothetical protein